MNLSEPTKAILKHLRLNYGETVLTNSQALNLFCGSGGTLEHLSDEELIQLALIQAHDAINDLNHEVEGLRLALLNATVHPNRAARRKR